MAISVPLRRGGEPSLPSVPEPRSAAQARADKGDKLFLIGCLVCGTWLLGAIGAVIIAIAVVMLRKAERQGAIVRPWTVTVIGGLMLVDASVNYLAWGLDLMPSHDSILGRTMWINYGLLVDGGYAVNYNTGPVGGVAITAEKAIQFATVFLVMPAKIAGAWGLLKMKRWGLQWSIVANWLYFCLWASYCVAMALQFDARFGTSDWGVLGFWLVGGLPFLGPVVILPYLNTVNRELWSR